MNFNKNLTKIKSKYIKRQLSEIDKDLKKKKKTTKHEASIYLQ